jgi:hypothetical protein
LQVLPDCEAAWKLGDDGPALVCRARGEDARIVDPPRETKSISAETTFDRGLSTVSTWNVRSEACAKSWPDGSSNRTSPGGVALTENRPDQLANAIRSAVQPDGCRISR